MKSLICGLLLELGALNVIGQAIYTKLKDLELIAESDKEKLIQSSENEN